MQHASTDTAVVCVISHWLSWLQHSSGQKRLAQLCLPIEGFAEEWLLHVTPRICGDEERALL